MRQDFETGADFLLDLEREFRTGAALAECQGGVFRLSIEVCLPADRGREIAGLLASIRARPEPAPAPDLGVAPEPAASLWGRLTDWPFSVVVAFWALCLAWGLFNG